MKASILHVEDDLKISRAVSDFLTSHQYHVTHALTGKEALSYLETEIFDLVLLDLMLPDMNGESIAKVIKEQYKIPILMTTAKVSEDEVVAGFEAGARDYLKKPFGLRELMARIDVLVPSKLSFDQGELMIDPSTRSLYIHQEVVKLTHHEYQLLWSLVKHANQILTREQLISNAFGYEYEGYERTIDSHIKNLRAKLQRNQPSKIETIRGVGYRFIGKAD